MKRVGQTTLHKNEKIERAETEAFSSLILPEAPQLQKARSTVPNERNEAKEIYENTNAERIPHYNFNLKLKLPDQSPNSTGGNYAYSTKDKDDSNRGLFDKVLDITGDAFEKFGNFLRGDSTEKKLANSTPIATEAMQVISP